MKKHILLGIVIAVVVAGLGLMIGSQSINFGESLGSLGKINARVLALVALPFVFLVFVLGNYLRKKNEDRRWKNAILESRTKNQKKTE